MWTSTRAPSAVAKCSLAPTWRSLSGWITAPQLLVHSAFYHSVFFFTPPRPSFTPPFSPFTHILQVFHLLTSSVNVVINGSGSRFRPAQAFVVPCGKNSKPWRATRSSSLGQLSILRIVLFTVVCSLRTRLQHPECLGPARCLVLHQDVFRKLRLKTAAWTSIYVFFLLCVNRFYCV